MEIFLIRHASAVPHAIDQIDAERPLTPEGCERFRRGVRGLDSLGVRFDRLLHSPLLRAVQTAEELAGLLDGESIVTPHLATAPSGELLEQLVGAGSVALVGHEPWMSELASGLLADPSRAYVPIEFKKGAVCWLRGDPDWGGAELVAHFPPRVLRGLG